MRVIYIGTRKFEDTMCYGFIFENGEVLYIQCPRVAMRSKGVVQSVTAPRDIAHFAWWLSDKKINLPDDSDKWGNFLSDLICTYACSPLDLSDVEKFEMNDTEYGMRMYNLERFLIHEDGYIPVYTVGE